MYPIIAAFLTAYLVSFFSIPSIIKVAHIKNLCDEPDERRAHKGSIPTLGGLGIFAGLMFAVTFWLPESETLKQMQYILSAYLVIFLIGAKDDMVPLTPGKKFGGQFLAALILVGKADIYLSSFYGIFGIYDIPYALSVVITIFVMLLIINALNLIDGINGLAGSIGIITSATFGYWFYAYGNPAFAIVAFGLVGALLAFLHYNITPARIFMGDTGSLLVGLSLSILSILFIESNKVPAMEGFVNASPAVAVAILIIPLFDTLRVFVLRALKGKSPFSPDKTHIHHLLLALGLSHVQSTMTLAIVNIVFILMAYLLQGIGTLWLMIVVFAFAGLLTGIAYVLVKRKERQEKNLQRTT